MEPSFIESKGTNNLAKAIASLNGENSYSVPNRFEVLILPPGKGKRWNAQEVSLRCESILLPGRNLNTLTDGMPYGPTREIVDGVTYAEDITMTFVASGGLEERIFLEEWQEIAFNKKTISPPPSPCVFINVAIKSSEATTSFIHGTNISSMLFV